MKALMIEIDMHVRCTGSGAGFTSDCELSS